MSDITFGGCPFCGRKNCVAGQCRQPASGYGPKNFQEITGFHKPVASEPSSGERAIKYVPVDSKLRDANWKHPNDDESCDADCRQALNERGDDHGQGLDNYWKWGFKAGWNAKSALLSSDAKPASEPNKSAYMAALEIRASQGWKLTGKAIPVLYTDTINGQQVMRDDVWLCTTAALRNEASEPVAVPQLQKLSEDEVFEIWKQHETDNRFVFADAIMEAMLSAATSPAPVGIKKENQ